MAELLGYALADLVSTVIQLGKCYALEPPGF